ncbi:hypothetical protein ACFLYB_02680 [Chloroflexota bacterium]
MTVRIVTDSTAGLLPSLFQEEKEATPERRTSLPLLYHSELSFSYR